MFSDGFDAGAVVRAPATPVSVYLAVIVQADTFKMRRRIIVTFIFSAGIVLLLTAVAKIISSFGESKILNEIDPLFHVSFRWLFRAVAVVELGIAGICFFSKNLNLRVGLIATLAMNFLLYRFGLYWMGFGGRCSCLGNLTDALHISPTLADRVMEIILGYLLVGSFAVLIWNWWPRREIREPVPSSAPS